MNYEKKQHIDLRLEWNSQKVGYDLFFLQSLVAATQPKKNILGKFQSSSWIDHEKNVC